MNNQLKVRNQTKSQERQLKGLARLEDIYFTAGASQAEQSFREIAHEEELINYSRIRAGGGRPSFRTDVKNEDGIKYCNYSPPRGWEAPYSVQWAEFEPVPKSDFMYHGGEELLIPASGEVMYHFFWSPGCKSAERILLKAPLSYGSILRLNPQVPHHTWSTSESGAKAWMFFRYSSGSPRALTVDSPYHQKPRRITEQKLKEAGKYALVAWGIAEKIRNYRLRANFSVKQLAKAVRATSSYISRIEAADTNVSLQMLIDIARVLNIGLSDFIPDKPWHYLLGRFSAGKYKTAQSMLEKPPSGRHLLHPLAYSLPNFETLTPETFDTTQAGDFTTWIVLRGKVVCEISEKGQKKEPALLDEGSVMHFRAAMDITFQALSPTQLLRVKFSGDCDCCLEKSENREK